MVDSIEMANDRIKIVRNDKVAFDTQAPSLHLFPAAKLASSMSLVFPDLLSGLLYNSYNSSQSVSACESWSCLLAQEWAYNVSDYNAISNANFPNDLTSYRNLPQQSLGTVPAGTEFLDVRVRLTKTKLGPIYFNNFRAFQFAPDGQWISLQGGSCPVEMLAYMMRHFDIVLEGTNVYLRRYQSVRTFPLPGFTNVSNGNVRGWVTNPANRGAEMGGFNNSRSGQGYPMVLLDYKTEAAGTKFPPWGTNSTNACAIGADIDYEVIYAMDYEIIPGRYT